MTYTLGNLLKSDSAAKLRKIRNDQAIEQITYMLDNPTRIWQSPDGTHYKIFKGYNSVLFYPGKDARLGTIINLRTDKGAEVYNFNNSKHSNMHPETKKTGMHIRGMIIKKLGQHRAHQSRASNERFMTELRNDMHAMLRTRVQKFYGKIHD